MLLYTGWSLRCETMDDTFKEVSCKDEAKVAGRERVIWNDTKARHCELSTSPGSPRPQVEAIHFLGYQAVHLLFLSQMSVSKRFSPAL